MSFSNISVVVPFYNRSNCLSRLLNGIYEQTLLPDMVYLVDNGSSFDESMAAQSIISQYDNLLNITYFCSLNRYNANYSRNAGLYVNLSKYVAFLDSDDWWAPGFLESAYKKLNNSEFCGTYSGAKKYAYNSIMDVYSSEVSSYPSPIDFLFSDGNIAQTSSYVINTEKLNKVTWDNTLKRHQDYDFFIKVQLNTSGWTYNPTTHVNFERQNDNSQRNFDFKSMIKFLNRYEKNFNDDVLIRYLSLQLDACILSNASHRYYNYYYCKLIKINKSQSHKVVGHAYFRRMRLLIIRFIYFLGIKDFIIRLVK
jgi:glycosyltransferase involved in cell wall biosynthesis